jgi:hypothetical protein
VPVTAAVAAVRSCPSSLTGCCVFSWVCVSVAPSLVALSVCQLGPPIRDCKHAAVFVWFLGCWVPGLSFEERKALGLTKPDPTVHASCCVYPRRAPIPEELYQLKCHSQHARIAAVGGVLWSQWLQQPSQLLLQETCNMLLVYACMHVLHTAYYKLVGRAWRGC